ncbi:periplasmic heavy metal sensor [bacterium]|nr:periplasmic heavy metal sensor [bacterium]
MKTQQNMSRRNLILVVAALAALGLAATALAQGPGPRGGRGPGAGGPDGDFDGGPRLERLQAHLDLTDEQVAAIEDLHEKTRTKNTELRKELLRLRNDKRGEMLKDEPSAGKLVELTRKIGEVRTEMQVNRVETRLAVRKLLTPEQRDKMLLGEGRRGGRGAGFEAGRGQGGRGGRGDCGGGGSCEQGPGQGRGRGQGQGRW